MWEKEKKSLFSSILTFIINECGIAQRHITELWAYVNQLGDYIADNETKEQDKQSK